MPQVVAVQVDTSTVRPSNPLEMLSNAVYVVIMAVSVTAEDASVVSNRLAYEICEQHLGINRVSPPKIEVHRGEERCGSNH